MKLKSQGGAEYQNYLLKNELETANYEVSFISMGDKREKYLDGQTLIFYLPKGKLTRKFGDNYFLYIPRVLQLLKEINPDYIYLRGGVSWILAGALFAQRNNKRFIWAVASDEDVKPLKFEALSNFLFNFIDRSLANLGKRRASVIITQTYKQKEFLQVYLGLSANEVVKNYLPEPTEIINKPEDKLRIIWVANFSKNKQPELFVELAAMLRFDQSFEFLMIGRPYEKSRQMKIESKISQLKNLKYLGNLTQDEVNKLLAQSHILVNTSIVEGFPNVFIQAMLRKTIVASLNSDPDSIFTHFNCGYCSDGSLKALLSFLKMVAEDTNKLIPMANNAFTYSVSNHLIKNQVAKLMKFFS